MCVLIEKKKKIVCDVLQDRDLVKGKSTLTDLQNKYSGTVFLSYREMVNKRGKKKNQPVAFNCSCGQAIGIQSNLHKV